jgi:hypothetical protein
MGLDFSHTTAQWSYSGFSRFRDALATHEGIDLDQMEGFRRRGDDRPRIPWTGITGPLVPLLNHSDCDGELSPEECRQIAPRLRAVVNELWPAETHSDFDADPNGYHNRSSGLALADGMDTAAAAGEPLRFE